MIFRPLQNSVWPTAGHLGLFLMPNISRTFDRISLKFLLKFGIYKKIKAYDFQRPAVFNMATRWLSWIPFGAQRMSGTV